MTGKTAPGAGSSKLRRRPSHGRQPKFAPRPRPFLTKSISSTSSWPTSPIDEVAVGAVEREAPRVAQAVGVDLAAGARAPDERVRGRDRVRPAARGLGVDAQDLAQRRAERLRVAARAVLVVAAAPVAGADVHQLVGPEDHEAAVVVGLGVGHAQHEARAVRVGAVSPARWYSQMLSVPLLLGVVDVEEPRLRVVGGEGHREQALLAAGRDLRADVEERLGEGLAALHDHDPPGLLDDEDPALVAGRRGDVERGLEVADLDEAHPAAGRRATLGGARAEPPVSSLVLAVALVFVAAVSGVGVRAAGRDERGGERERARRLGGASGQDAMAL